MIMGSILIALILGWYGNQITPQVMESSRSIHPPPTVQVKDDSSSLEPQTSLPSPIIKGSQTPLAESPYGEIFNKESEELPFYLKPQFDGLDASDHRRQIRPNSAGQRLDMDQYNKQVRPSVGP